MQIAVVSRAGAKMSAGAALWYEARRAITVEGTICTDVALIINNRLRPNMLPSPSNAFIAFTPKGVAAPPRPSTLQVTFIAAYCAPNALLVLKNL